MAWRDFWARMVDFVYDIAGDFLRTQEDIDILIENEFLAKGYRVIYNDEPEGAKARKRTFYSHDDALHYASSIPANYVTIAIFEPIDETDDDVVYEVWVDET